MKIFSTHKILRKLCLLATLIWSFAFWNCASNKGHSDAIAPEDMPEICHDLDFNRDAHLREVCGVKTRSYMAYRNYPEHRSLLLPKGGKIVKKDNDLELRLESTLPINLPENFKGKINFDENIRRVFIKSKMDYCEFFPENSNVHVKIIRLTIPTDAGDTLSICYTLEPKITTAQRKTGFASRLEPMECVDFQKLKEKP